MMVSLSAKESSRGATKCARLAHVQIQGAAGKRVCARERQMLSFFPPRFSGELRWAQFSGTLPRQGEEERERDRERPRSRLTFGEPLSARREETEPLGPLLWTEAGVVNVSDLEAHRPGCMEPLIAAGEMP